MQKTLVCIANHGTSQLRHLVTVLDAWNQCEGWIDVVLHTTHPFYIEYPRLRIYNVLCRPEAQALLVWAHRALMAEKIWEYDRFVYCDNDILITPQTIACWESLSATLPNHLAVGFLRYEVSEPPDGEQYLPDAHGDYPVFESVELIGSELYFSVLNKHQGCFLLTQSQVQLAIQSGGFLRTPAPNPPYGLVEAGNCDVYTLCGLKKVYPLQHLEDLLVHHLSNRYANTNEGIWVRKPHTVRSLKELVASHLLPTAAIPSSDLR